MASRQTDPRAMAWRDATPWMHSHWLAGRRQRRGRSGAGFLGALAAATLLAAASFHAAAAPANGADGGVHRRATLQVPGRQLTVFDGSAVDGNTYALADRSNRGVDLFDARTDRFLGRAGGFAGFNRKQGFAAAGPNGLAAVGPGQIWGGDGDSTVKIVDLRTRRVIGAVATGGVHRVDELTYDRQDHLVVAANNADKPPFLSFISTKPGHRVVGRLVLKQATDGLEQPMWDAADDRIYVAVPELDHKAADGGIAVIDPATRALLRMIPVRKCLPAGLAVGPHQQLLVGCSDDAVAAGFPAKSLILQLPSGKPVRSIRQVGGSDEVWFDRAQGRYYLSAVANPGGPVLGVIDAGTDRWVANVPTGPHAHSVAADGAADRVFVPIAANGTEPGCHAGCIAVFTAGR